MTDSPSSDAQEDGQSQQPQPPQPPQPWFPPAGGYSAPGHSPETGPGAGQPGPGQPAAGQPGYGQPGQQVPSGWPEYGPPGYGPPGQAGYGQPGQPGYGQPGYGPPPPGQGPRYGQAAPKPGVIPLRPLGLGEILDGAFSSIRRNPKATLGLAAIVMTVSAVISTTLSLTLLNLSGGLNFPQPGQQLTPDQAAHLVGRIFAAVVPALAVSVLLTIIVQAVLAGLLAHVIAQGISGQQVSAAEAWRATRPRVGRLLLATLLVLLVSFGPLLVVGLLILIAFAAGAPAAVYAAVGSLGGLAAIVLLIWFSVRLSLVTPVVVLEGAGPGRALARSWQLVRRSFWRVFGILLLAALIVAIAGGILQIPFTVIGAVLASHGGISIGGTIIGAIGAIAAGAVTRPITAGVTVLLYVDMRMRKEGLDLALRSATGTGAPGPGLLTADEFAAVWRPPSAAPAPGPDAAMPTPGAPPSATGAPPPW
jgi:hypothetical protein